MIDVGPQHIVQQVGDVVTVWEPGKPTRHFRVADPAKPTDLIPAAPPGEDVMGPGGVPPSGEDQ